MIAVLWAVGKILDWFQERGFGKVINDETDKVDSTVHPERFEERTGPKKASAPTAPATKPTQRQTPTTKPQPAAQAKPSNSQQPSSRPSKGKARGAQSTSGAKQRPAQAPASSQSSEPKGPGFYSMGAGAIAPERVGRRKSS